MSVQIVIALIDLVAVTVLIVRRMDVRLVLLAGAVPLFAVSGGLKADAREAGGRDGQSGDGGADMHGAGLRLRIADYRM